MMETISQVDSAAPPGDVKNKGGAHFSIELATGKVRPNASNGLLDRPKLCICISPDTNNRQNYFRESET